MVRREAWGREGMQDAAALRYCRAVAFLEISEFQQLPHGAITPQYYLHKHVISQHPAHSVCFNISHVSHNKLLLFPNMFPIRYERMFIYFSGEF
jgi:hypothetical protein